MDGSLAATVAKETSINDFGLLIAYVLPGFTALWGMSFLVAPLRSWFGTPPAQLPTVGGFFFATLASVCAGLTLSTLRWLVIDSLHHRTGIPAPVLDFARLPKREAAFYVIVEGHFRYYAFYGNMLVALAVVLVAKRLQPGELIASPDSIEGGLLLLMGIFFLGSRDTLRKYYTRSQQLLTRRRGGSAQHGR